MDTLKDFKDYYKYNQTENITYEDIFKLIQKYWKIF